MQRMLCSVLSLAIITSSLSGCATAPAQPEIVGPDVYGYTLYQPLSSEQFEPLTKTRGFYTGALELYLQAAPDGGVLGLYVGGKHWLDTVSKTSKLYVTQPECEAAWQAEEGQLKALVDGFNARQTQPPRLGDYYAVQTVDACKPFKGQGYRYTAWTTLHAFDLDLRQRYPYKTEVHTSRALDIAVMVVAVPLVVAVVILTGGQGMSDCTYTGTVEEGKQQCDKKLEAQREQKRHKELERDTLEAGYH
ncbi:hypothetical protein [Pseudomonas cremoris]|uniref:hypothetical protein n=1 Tax=Pseudomonas cremoris TaxID=2724178 RepID=UPI00289C246D|nr:hypothetical protein [Pseudomonas cremoris]